MYDQIKENDETLNSHVLHSRFDREDRKNFRKVKFKEVWKRHTTNEMK